MSSDIKDLIRAARLPERTVAICLDMSINAEIETLERELAEMSSQPDMATLLGDPRRQKAEQIRALEQQGNDSTVIFRLRALPRLKYTALLRDHPVRKDDDGDAIVGFNRDTFFAALVRASTVEPVLDDEYWTELLGSDEVDGKLSARQFDELAGGAFEVNRRDVDVPKSLRASEILRTFVPE